MDNTVLYYHTKPRRKSSRKTFAGIVDGNTITIGMATCSTKDNFSRATGRSIAEGRAIKKPIAVRTHPDGWSVLRFVLFCKEWAGEPIEEYETLTID